MKKLFSLLFVALLAMSAWADTVVVMDFSKQNYSNGDAVTECTVDNVTATFDKGTGSNVPKYYDTGSAIRLYGGNTMTITAPTNLKSIVFTFGSGEGSNEITSNVGNYVTANKTWTIGSSDPSKTVVFTIGGTSGHRRLQKLEITIEDAEPVGELVAPVFHPNGGTFSGSLEVTLTCATENASIWYWEGTEENMGEWIYYQEPFYVTETKTYTAVSTKGNDMSDYVTVTFTKEIPTCAKPTFTPANGTTFLEGEMITVTINCATEGATITYTVNDDIFEGIAPVQVPVDETCTITAVASKDGYNDSEEASATYTMVVPATEGPIFTLVTDLNDLAAGDKIIFVNSKEDGTAVAMAGRNGNNNFASVNVVVDNGQVQTNQANIVTLEENGDFWNFKTPEGYLYAPGGGNYLRLENEVDSYGNANAAITIGTDTTIIKFQGSGTQKYMRSNPNNGTPLFSCYAENSSVKGLVYIYKTTEQIIEVVAPEISPASNTTFVGSQQVTITCATEGAEIYYSFDEENWTKYEAPFTITESCTVYAYAKLGDAQSTIVSAKYYKAIPVQNIGEALALNANDDFVFNGEAIVTYQNGINTWIKDATGYGLIYGSVPEMATGTVIADGWTAYLKDYYGVPEFASPKNVAATEDVVTVEPEEKETVTNDDVNMYIIMKDQALVADTVASTWLNAAGLKFFDKFGVNPTIEEGKTYDVVGVVTIYKNNPEVYIISVTETADEFLRGDVDDNGSVNITDVTALINYLLSKNAEGVNLQAADCDQSGSINISDVTALINYLLSKNWPAE